MDAQGKLLAVVPVPYDFVAKDGVNQGQRMTGTNYNHIILRNDHKVVTVSVKKLEDCVAISPKIIEALPLVNIGYTTFNQKNERNQIEEVLRAESVSLIAQ